ncbi:primosomal protein N' [Anaerococcus tetradius]|uniref:Replication restart protein PriA n=1 Tax=Anaerococcus tetradius ATCC 35098 TaxID=525255 RepID=C2CFK6_9FIRM|nr:primosomal protein N' [Anaerococcus tetradius]EEI83654.1 primosomal protein N' [Anaerococcus tetradius ATCC 35098]
MYAKVILDTNSRFLDRSFTYKVPERFLASLSLAMRVLVPFGKSNKAVLAFVYEITEEIEADYKIKEIIDLVDDRKLISNELIDLAFFMSKRYLSPIQASLRQVLPPTSIKDIHVFYKNISNLSNEFLDFLNEKREIKEIKERFPDYKEKLYKYLADNIVRQSFDVKRTQKIQYIEYARLNKDCKFILNANAVKQKKIIDYLSKNGLTDVKSLLAKSAASRSSLNSLVNKNIILIEKKEADKEIKSSFDQYKKFDLNEEQERAFNTIKSKKNGHFLLYGVTGSGKTEIFLQMVEEVIKDEKEAIILVPEISLTPQTIERFKGRFKEKIAIMHSRLTPREKFNQWRMINNGEVKIVIGARSAIFAPFKNLGIIIIDEEHDGSYISSNDPKYHTDEIAIRRANYHSCNLILASATPSIITMDRVKRGAFDLIRLENRINNNMPIIEVVDMREELKKSNYSMISEMLRDEIIKNLENKQQSILFLNKVGHDSFTFCRACGNVIKCEACDVAMTYHKNVDRLVCHYCGRTKKQPTICPVCHSKKIKEFGAGTEKLEEEVKLLFPEANIMRMDSMTATNKEMYEKMYKGMKENKIDILLGTQMIAKGLDFKNVSLVGIISADLSLNVGDFKANETTFQLLTQVSGRAGRDKLAGRVVIQSYRPDNFVIQAAKNNDYESFCDYELNLRKAFNYPPYKNLLTIRIVNESRIKTIDISKMFYKSLCRITRKDSSIEIIGPNPCKIARINNKFRYNILIKVNDNDLNYLINCVSKVRKDFINKYKDTSFIPALNPTNIN